ncbi:alpha/beta fold hydrolase [Enterococcus sp. BWR-S5]|uniref:alpha/beta fold hydrolase n=1 Tax=Enterococcus sp. BWR-S5 TaxID=2787714 RepID=UPI00192377DF|nr:alpha/beta hydrolase [Enterococcus sp. BWR-S5]MBL1227382.1 alpha/beta hydrolase [Enterococcus sp. BWR-S5]
METINRDGYHIQFFQQGDLAKPPILIIGSVFYYPKLFQSNQYKKLNLIFMDHRGFLKPDTSNSYSLESVVEDIEQVRRFYRFDTFYLLGHSGHGFMAMSYAKQYPKRVKGLILSNLAPTNSNERQQQSITYFEKNASTDRKTYFKNEIEKLSQDIEKDPQNRFSHVNIRMQAQSFYDYTFDGAYLWTDVYNNMAALDYLWRTAFSTFDTEQFIHSFTKPVLLLLSDYDFLVAPTSLWQPIISDTDVTLFKFAKSGHNPMLEEPEKYYQLLDKFAK